MSDNLENDEEQILEDIKKGKIDALKMATVLKGSDKCPTDSK